MSCKYVKLDKICQLLLDSGIITSWFYNGQYFVHFPDDEYPSKLDVKGSFKTEL